MEKLSEAANKAASAAMAGADKISRAATNAYEKLDEKLEKSFGLGGLQDDGFEQYTAMVKSTTVPEGCPEGGKTLELVADMILLVHGQAEGKWMVCSYQDVGSSPLDEPRRIDGLVHSSCINSMHDELMKMQKEALKSEFPRRVAVYPFDTEAATKVGKREVPTRWPWEKIVDRRPLKMQPGNMLEVIDSQLSPWLHCKLVGVEGPEAKGYCPENYSLEVMDYCDMMKAWEAELLGQYAEAIGAERPRSPAGKGEGLFDEGKRDSKGGGGGVKNSAATDSFLMGMMT
jgi:hypothetical protein